MSKPVFSDGRVHVMAEKCETCIFRPGNLMHLRQGTVKMMVEASIEQGAGITCHSTLPGMKHDAQQATCRGFYDTHADKVLAYRLAAALGAIEEVTP